MQLQLTRDFVRKSKRSADVEELDDLEARMAASGYNASSAGQGTICDTVFMLWPVADGPAIRLSQLWFAEVAMHSAFEKASFAWVASKLSTPLRKLFVSSLYIYEPEQRCCAKFPNGTAQPCRPKSPNENSSSKTSRRRSKKRGMLKRQMRRLTMI